MTKLELTLNQVVKYIEDIGTKNLFISGRGKKVQSIATIYWNREKAKLKLDWGVGWNSI